MSWESSAQYYRLVNELVHERLGGLHSARVLLASVDFADVEELQAEGRWDGPASYSQRLPKAWRPAAPNCY